MEGSRACYVIKFSDEDRAEPFMLCHFQLVLNRDIQTEFLDTFPLILDLTNPVCIDIRDDIYKDAPTVRTAKL